MSRVSKCQNEYMFSFSNSPLTHFFVVMKKDISNPLRDSGLPHFFKVANTEKVDLGTLALRKGDAVRTCVRSLSHMQKEALVSANSTGTVWRLASDEGDYLQGQDECPCPLSFLTTGMVSSYMNEILALAAMRNIEIKNIRLTQDNYYTMNGSMRKGTMIGGALPVLLDAEIESDASMDDLRKLVMDATVASPLNGLLTGVHDSLFKLGHNGQEITPKGVGEIEGDLYKEISVGFDNAQPAESTLDEPIILRKGMSPKTDEVTSSEGSSLKENQSRQLHVRGICTLRPDGMKEVEQHLYNPHGSIFRYLSEEGETNGGQGRAPDANSYISAGIAFCFMTQFGRYASIMKTDLERYSIIQDTHFSLGGATGKTGKAGSADPVETHVFLHSSNDDQVAKDTLYMSERTCFLHALCRTDLKPKVSVKKV